MELVVCSTSVLGIMDGSTKLSFTTRSAWLAIRPECQYLRWTCAHLRQGTHPSRKGTNIKVIKRYLNVATIASDGLLVVKRNKPFVPAKEFTIFPRSVLHGLLTSIHLQLSHPSANLMKIVMKRSSLLWIWRRPLIVLQRLVLNAQHSSSSHTLLLNRPHLVHMRPFAAHLLLTLWSEKNRLYYYAGMLFLLHYWPNHWGRDNWGIPSRNHSVLSRSKGGPFAVVRTDPAPWFQAFVNDSILKSHRISIELGRFKNANQILSQNMQSKKSGNIY